MWLRHPSLESSSTNKSIKQEGKGTRKNGEQQCLDSISGSLESTHALLLLPPHPPSLLFPTSWSVNSITVLSTKYYKYQGKIGNNCEQWSPKFIHLNVAFPIDFRSRPDELILKTTLFKVQTKKKIVLTPTKQNPIEFNFIFYNIFT